MIHHLVTPGSYTQYYFLQAGGRCPVHHHIRWHAAIPGGCAYIRLKHHLRPWARYQQDTVRMLWHWFWQRLGNPFWMHSFHRWPWEVPGVCQGDDWMWIPGMPGFSLPTIMIWSEFSCPYWRQQHLVGVRKMFCVKSRSRYQRLLPEAPGKHHTDPAHGPCHTWLSGAAPSLWQYHRMLLPVLGRWTYSSRIQQVPAEPNQPYSGVYPHQSDKDCHPLQESLHSFQSLFPDWGQRNYKERPWVGWKDVHLFPGRYSSHISDVWTMTCLVCSRTLLLL